MHINMRDNLVNVKIPEKNVWLSVCLSAQVRDQLLQLDTNWMDLLHTAISRDTGTSHVCVEQCTYVCAMFYHFYLFIVIDVLFFVLFFLNAPKSLWCSTSSKR